MKRKKSRKYYIGWIMKQYKEFRVYVLVLLFLTVINTIVLSLYPMVSKYTIDSITENLKLFESGKIGMSDVVHERNRLLLIFVMFGIGMFIANFYPYLRGKLNMHFEVFLRNKYFAHVMEKNYKFFLKYRTGDIATRLTSDLVTHPPGIPWFLCSGIFRALASFCEVVACLVIMFTLDYKLTLLCLIPIPFVVVVFLKLERFVEKKFGEQKKAVSITNDFLEAAYTGIRIIKSFNSEKYQINKFSNVLDNRFEVEKDVVSIHGLFHIYFTIIVHFSQVLVLLIGGISVLKGNIGVGTYFAFYSYLGNIVFPLIDIPQLFVTGSQSFMTIDRLDSLKNRKSSREYGLENTDHISENIKELSVKNLNFTFPENKESINRSFGLKDINLEINKGEKVAVVGKIGSGKTTLLNLLSGIYKPDTGEILINNQNINSLNIDSFREKIGYIQQQPIIFSETIYTNIDFWREYSRGWIEHSADIAQFAQEVFAMEKGFSELIGQRGIGLSGGQKQRLSIARAIAGRPELLMMDDVTSALDAENERLFWKRAENEFTDMTCIIVTHRISTAQKADRIIVLDNGSIEAIGKHSELLETSETYKELVNS